jgi:hypothetical protein
MLTLQISSESDQRVLYLHVSGILFGLELLELLSVTVAQVARFGNAAGRPTIPKCISTTCMQAELSFPIFDDQSGIQAD